LSDNDPKKTLVFCTFNYEKENGQHRLVSYYNKKLLIPQGQHTPVIGEECLVILQDYEPTKKDLNRYYKTEKLKENIYYITTVVPQKIDGVTIYPMNTFIPQILLKESKEDAIVVINNPKQEKKNHNSYLILVYLKPVYRNKKVARYLNKMFLLNQFEKERLGENIRKNEFNDFGVLEIYASSNEKLEDIINNVSSFISRTLKEVNQ